MSTSMRKSERVKHSTKTNKHDYGIENTWSQEHFHTEKARRACLRVELELGQKLESSSYRRWGAGSGTHTTCSLYDLR